LDTAASLPTGNIDETSCVRCGEEEEDESIALSLCSSFEGRGRQRAQVMGSNWTRRVTNTARRAENIFFIQKTVMSNDKLNTQENDLFSNEPISNGDAPLLLPQEDLLHSRLAK
jgi:hypothetical protein